VVVGLALAIPLVAITGSRRLGLGLRRLGLLLIPEERAPPAELARAGALYRALGAAPPATASALATDADLRAAHTAMLPPPRRPRIDPIDVPLLAGLARLDEADTLDQALGALSRAEKLAVLGNAGGVARLARGLEHGLAVMVQAEPFQAFEDNAHGFRGGAGFVCVLDAQQELAAGMFGEEVVEEGGPGAADMQQAGGGGGEADAWGHGGGVGQRKGSRKRSHFCKKGLRVL